MADGSGGREGTSPDKKAAGLKSKPTLQPYQSRAQRAAKGDVQGSPPYSTSPSRSPLQPSPMAVGTAKFLNSHISRSSKDSPAKTSSRGGHAPGGSQRGTGSLLSSIRNDKALLQRNNSVSDSKGHGNTSPPQQQQGSPKKQGTLSPSKALADIASFREAALKAQSSPPEKGGKQSLPASKDGTVVFGVKPFSISPTSPRAGSSPRGISRTENVFAQQEEPARESKKVPEARKHLFGPKTESAPGGMLKKGTEAASTPATQQTFPATSTDTSQATPAKSPFTGGFGGFGGNSAASAGFGSSFGFGGTSGSTLGNAGPVFGASSTPAFGRPSASTNPSSGLGSEATPTPAFGSQSLSSVFGSKSLFGAKPTDKQGNVPEATEAVSTSPQSLFGSFQRESPAQTTPAFGSDTLKPSQTDGIKLGSGFGTIFGSSTPAAEPGAGKEAVAQRQGTLFGNGASHPNQGLANFGTKPAMLRPFGGVTDDSTSRGAPVIHPPRNFAQPGVETTRALPTSTLGGRLTVAPADSSLSPTPSASPGHTPSSTLEVPAQPGKALAWGSGFANVPPQTSKPISLLAGKQAPSPVAGGMKRDAETLSKRAQRFAGLDNPVNAAPSSPSPLFGAGPVERTTSTVSDSAMDPEEELGKGTLEGTCSRMCPEAEQEFRQRMRDIDSFEREEDGGPPVLAVKKFARNVDQVASNFRTLGTLQRTQAHLMAVLDRQDVPLAKIHHFLWDRFRGIRQDLFVQGYEDARAVALYEEHVRFMILAEHELTGHSGDSFNSHLNLEQINKACISLTEMYDQARAAGQPIATEGEFRAYHLLISMGTHGKYRYNSTEYRKALKECEPVKDHPFLVVAMHLRGKLATGNFASFFKSVLEAPYLIAALAHMYFPTLRAFALTLFARTRQGKNDLYITPVTALQAELYLDSQAQVGQICDTLKLAVEESPEGYQVVIPKKGFKATGGQMPKYPSLLISQKLDGPRSAAVCGFTKPAPWDGRVPRALPAMQIKPTQGFPTFGQPDVSMDRRAEQQEQERREQEAQLQAHKEQREVQRRMLEEMQRAEAERRRQQMIEEENRRRAEEGAAEKQRALLKAEALRKEAEAREQQRQIEMAKRAKEAAERRAREERERLAELERKRQEEEARARAAAEEAERKRIEEERKAKLEAERKRRAAEEAARRRELAIQAAQKRAVAILHRLRDRYIIRKCLLHWVDLIRRQREERARREQRRTEALSRCRVGPLSSPPITVAPPLPAPTNKEVPKLIQSQPEVQLGNCFKPLVDAYPESAVIYSKIAFLATPAVLPHDRDPANWLRHSLLGDRKEGGYKAVDCQRLTFARADESSAEILSAFRDVWAPSSSTEGGLAKGLQGTTGILLHLSAQDEPQNLSLRLRKVLSALPTEGGLPLLVLVHSQSFVEPVSSWLKAELTQKSIAHSQVMALEGPDTTSSEVLSQALTWLLLHSPPQPQLQQTTLLEVINEELDLVRSTVRLATQDLDPNQCCTMFNGCLTAVEGRLETASQRAQALGGWPPEDCLPSNAKRHKGDWGSPETLKLQKDVLHDLKLSNMLFKGGDLSRELEQIGPMPIRTCPIPWKQAILEAFLYRILPCRSKPCVVLKREAKSDDLAAILTQLAQKSPQKVLGPDTSKRKWTPEAAVPLLLPAAVTKVQRTDSPTARGSYNTPQKAAAEFTDPDADFTPTAESRTMGRMDTASRSGTVSKDRADAAVHCRSLLQRENSHRKAGVRQKEGNLWDGVAETELFADLSLGPEDGYDSGSEIRKDMNSHTEWLNSLLAEGSTQIPAALQQETSPEKSEINLKKEIEENSKFLSMLANLKGGF